MEIQKSRSKKPLSVHMPTRDQEEIYGAPQKPEISSEGDDESSCGSMPALVDRPDDDSAAEHVLFIVDGSIELEYDGKSHSLETGGYAYLPAGLDWRLHNNSAEKAVFHWIRKRYLDVSGIDRPLPFITSDKAVTPVSMPDTDGAWQTSRFVNPLDISHDMHVNIVTFQPGGVIPFAETHVMEHGLYVLQGKGAYYLNGDWREVEGGDYMWLRAFCPQACYAAGNIPFRYLLYKDVNRHMPLHL